MKRQLGWPGGTDKVANHRAGKSLECLALITSTSNDVTGSARTLPGRNRRRAGRAGAPWTTNRHLTRNPLVVPIAGAETIGRGQQRAAHTRALPERLRPAYTSQQDVLGTGQATGQATAKRDVRSGPRWHPPRRITGTAVELGSVRRGFGCVARLAEQAAPSDGCKARGRRRCAQRATPHTRTNWHCCKRAHKVRRRRRHSMIERGRVASRTNVRLPPYDSPFGVPPSPGRQRSARVRAKRNGECC